MEIPNNPSFARKTLLWGAIGYTFLVASAVLLAFFFFPDDSYHLWINDIENHDAIQYRKYLQSSALILAMILGFWSAFYGAISKKWVYGIVALGIGLLISLGAFSTLPWLHFPNDQYSPGAIWMFVGLVPFVLAWALVYRRASGLRGKINNLHVGITEFQLVS